MSTLATPYVSNWPDWPLLLEQAATIVRSYDTSVTLRQLFYRLVAAELLPNTTNAYKALSKYSAEARRAGSARSCSRTTRMNRCRRIWRDTAPSPCVRFR